MKICIFSGSRADWGGLRWLLELMKKDSFFEVWLLKLSTPNLITAFTSVDAMIVPNMLMLLGDRFETLGAAIAAHLRRIPIAHLCGGDVTKGSYDDAMRDCISRLARLHFAASRESRDRLCALGYDNVHLAGSSAADYIMHGQWRKPRPIIAPYLLISYQPETATGANDIDELLHELPRKVRKIFILPNPDAGSREIEAAIRDYVAANTSASCVNLPEQDDFLNLLANCEEFIGNSSAIFYEAPLLGVKTRLVGKRQEGRRIPLADGHASERIIQILKEYHECR